VREVEIEADIHTVRIREQEIEIEIDNFKKMYKKTKWRLQEK